MRKAIIGAFGILMVVIITAVTGCTDNQRVKMGGSATVNIEPGQKVLSCTWKEGTDLWYLTRPFEKGEQPTTLQFQQKSSLGIRNGTLYLKESLLDIAKVASVQNDLDLSDFIKKSTP